jgi:hypothetical protein
MKHSNTFKTAARAALIVAAFSPFAMRADDFDKKTVITFADSVQVPGVTLPAGKYVFKLTESPAKQMVVLIYNERESHLMASVIAVANYRMTPPDKTVVTFYEAPVGQPEPIKAWFYPGDNVGRQFIYSKSEAEMIAKATKEIVPSAEASAVAHTDNIKETVVPADAQSQQAAAIATEPQIEAAKVAEPAVAPTPVAVAPMPQPTDTSAAKIDATPGSSEPSNTVAQPTTEVVANDTPTMPSTGSEWPLVGLIGFASLAGAISLRAIRRAN